MSAAAFRVPCVVSEAVAGVRARTWMAKPSLLPATWKQLIVGQFGKGILVFVCLFFPRVSVCLHR